jgi:hypothetical protein
VGAIVGGVVGGLALLLIILIVLFFVFRYRRSKNAKENGNFYSTPFSFCFFVFLNQSVVFFRLDMEKAKE